MILSIKQKNNRNKLSCDPEKGKCLFKRHEDFNDSKEQFTNSDIGKKYKQAGHHWLRIDKKLSEVDGNPKLVDRVIPKKTDTEKKVTKCDSHLYNQISNLEPYLDNIPGDLNKPLVSLELKDKQGNSTKYDALIDPGSYSLNSNSNNSEIVSYISDRLYNEIINLIPTHEQCSCIPTKTCTPTGCFTSTTCVKLNCKLKDEHSSTEDIQITFRIVKAMNDNQIIIGLNDVKKYDLTKVLDIFTLTTNQP